MPFWTHLAHLWPGKRGLSILLHQAVLNWGISRVLAEGKEGFLLHQREGAGLKLKADFRESFAAWQTSAEAPILLNDFCVAIHDTLECKAALTGL